MQQFEDFLGTGIFTRLLCLSWDYIDILHRFTPIIFFTLRDAVLDAKNYSRQRHKQVLQQGHNQVHARVSNQVLIDKYENKHIDKYKIR